MSIQAGHHDVIDGLPGYRSPAAPRRLPGQGAAPAWVLALAIGCASCSQSDSFIGAQIDHPLRQGTAPTLDLAKVGPVNWTRVCVLGPYTDDRAAQDLLGMAWPASRLTSLGKRDDRVALVFSDATKVLACVERLRAGMCGVDGAFAKFWGVSHDDDQEKRRTKVDVARDVCHRMRVHLGPERAFRRAVESTVTDETLLREMRA